MDFIILHSILWPTIIISIIAFKNVEIMDLLKFNPSHINNSKEWYRFLSYGLIHADFIHLTFNMYVLWSFGKIVLMDFNFLFEDKANLYFLLLYAPALAISVIPSYIKHRNNYFYSAVGASGAISAIVYTVIILNPTIGLGLIIIPISLPAWIFGLLYIIYTMIMSRKANTIVGHSAHLWGAIAGLVFLIITKPEAYLLFYYQIFG